MNGCLKVFIVVSVLLIFGAVMTGIIVAKERITGTASLLDLASSYAADEASDEGGEYSELYLATNQSEDPYLAAIATIMRNYFDAAGEHDELAAQAMADPELLKNRFWIAQSAIVSANFTRTSEIVKRTDVPPDFKPIHEQISSAADRFDSAIDLYKLAIDANNLAYLTQSAEDMRAAKDFLRTADQLIASMLQDDVADAALVHSVSDSTEVDQATSAETCKVNNNSNLRAGPGTQYHIVGGRTFGDLVYPVATNDRGDWFKLDSGEWIAAWLLDDAPSGLPIASTSFSASTQ